MPFAKKSSKLLKFLARNWSQEAVTCPEPEKLTNPVPIQSQALKPYSDIPGPRPIPILGNTWRLLPVIGQYDISDVAKLSSLFYQEYGKIVKLSGLVGRPDLLFVYDADEIEKVYR